MEVSNSLIYFEKLLTYFLEYAKISKLAENFVISK